MKKSVPFVLGLAVVLATACGGDRTELRRDQQQYDVVEEGAGGPVTGTIQAPGESALPPLTGTNADTTSAFTLPTTTDPAQSVPPGTLAGTLTTGTAADSMPRNPPSPSTRPAPRPAPTPPPAPTETRASEPEPEAVPAPTATQEPEEEPEPKQEPQTPPSNPDAGGIARAPLS